VIALLAVVSALAGETILLPAGSDWRYLDTGAAPDFTWVDDTFDDSAWPIGPAPLGYGLVALGTTVSYGPDAANRHITTWLRTEVNVADASLYEAFSIALQRDDGAAVYINGVEVARSNLPVAATATTLAIDPVFGVDQNVFLPFVVPDGVVVSGDNIIAIELHQQSVTSVDLVVDMSLSGWDAPTVVTRGPYLQTGTSQSMIVRWSTDGPSPGQLWWGDAPGQLTNVVVDSEIGFSHEVEVSGLAPDTVTFYAVGVPSGLVLAGDDADHAFETAPVPGSVQPVRVWVLGDSGTADASAASVRDAYSVLTPDPLDTDVWLMLGDNAYNSGTEQEHQEAVFDFYPELLRQVPVWPAIGNHEGINSFSSTQTGPYFDLFSLPAGGEAGGVASGTEAYYSFDYANVHFINLDSHHSDRSAGSAMLTWLAADLASTTADWLIAYWHHPPYSRGSHNSDFELQLVEMRENVVPVLEAGGVDMVLAGHSHSYERSLLIDGHHGLASSFDPSMVVQDHGGDPALEGAYRKWSPSLEPHSGAIYIVAGSSGQISGGLLDHPVMVRSLNSLGSVMLDIDGGVLEASFLDDVGLVLDRFALHKGVTTIVDISGPDWVSSGETASLTGLALQSDGTEVPSYLWDPGDGSAPVAGPTLVHTYSSPEGPVEATLTVTDAAGGQTSDTWTVQVDAGPPEIQLVGPLATTEGAATTFFVTATDPAADPLTVSWTIAGVAYDTVSPTHTFFDDGFFEIEVVVADDAGRTSTMEEEIAVGNLPPFLVSVTGTNLEQGEVATLTAIVDDPGLFDTVPVIEWDLPDGVPRFGATVVTVFAQSGVVPIGLTLTDDDGGVAVVTAELDIGNAAPFFDEITWDEGGAEGDPIRFTAVASDGISTDPVEISWDFGDGSPIETGGEVEHTFGDQGPFLATVTATDAQGESTVVPRVVTLANLPPRIIAVSAPPAAREGETVRWSATVEDPGVDDVVTQSWDFGDGTRTTGRSVSHAYADDGEYTVVLSLVDDEGATAEQVAQLQVDNVAPRFVRPPAERTVAPGALWQWLAEVEDPGQERIVYRLVGPDGSWVDPAGLVRWVAPEQRLGEPATFSLVADDGDETDTLEWQVRVAPDDQGPGCGCRVGVVPGATIWLLPLLGWRRRRTF